MHDSYICIEREHDLGQPMTTYVVSRSPYSLSLPAFKCAVCQGQLRHIFSGLSSGFGAAASLHARSVNFDSHFGPSEFAHITLDACLPLCPQSPIS
jgi:hypothetical protein